MYTYIFIYVYIYIICDHKLNWIHQREFQDPKMEVPIHHALVNL